MSDSFMDILFKIPARQVSWAWVSLQHGESYEKHIAARNRVMWKYFPTPFTPLVPVILCVVGEKRPAIIRRTWIRNGLGFFICKTMYRLQFGMTMTAST